MNLPFRNLTFQVLVAILLGVLLGALAPQWAVQLKPLADIFIRLIKLIIAPLVFLTVSAGIAGSGGGKQAGRIGVVSLIYFEILSGFALVIGMVVGNVFQPGAGISTANVDPQSISKFTEAEKSQSTLQYIVSLVPDNLIGALARGEMIPVLIAAILFGLALAASGDDGVRVRAGCNTLLQVLFALLAIIIKIAPLAAFAAMAYTVGQHGVQAIVALAKLMLCAYLTMALFVIIVLNLIMRAAGFSLWRFLVLINEELLIVLGTSSSESVLPRMMEKLQRFGCSRTATGLILPAGYSFNLDGTCIYLSMAVVFIAQAYGIDLSLSEQIGLLLLLAVTSNGAAAVVGSAFITLGATLAATGTLPIEGMALLLGVDRFMAEARSITNLIGNGVATLVLSRGLGELDQTPARAYGLLTR